MIECKWWVDGCCQKDITELRALADGQQVIILPVTKLETPVFTCHGSASIADAVQEYGRFLAEKTDYEFVTQSLNNAGWHKERTCRDTGSYDTFCCSACGAEVDTVDREGEATIWTHGSIASDVNYCPNCGAKVVE